MNRDIVTVNVSKSVSGDGFLHYCGMFLLFSLCPLLLYKPVFQNDTYWLLNTGRYIAQNGFPLTEPFTMHRGLHFMAQQWLSTVIFHKSYQVGGVAAIHALVIGTSAIILFLVYLMALRLAGGKKLIASYITAFIGVSLSSFVMPRPQLFSLCVFVAAISLLEYCVDNPKFKPAVVVGLPLLSVLLINLHAAMWPILFLLCVPYLIDGIKFKIGRIEGQGYDTKPLYVGISIAVLSGYANPYGIQAMTYLFHSYGNGVINSHVQEMFSPDFKSLSGLFIFGVVLTVALIYYLAPGSTRLRYALISVGTLYMGLSSVRSFALFIIFGLVFLSCYLKDVDLSRAMPARKRAILVCVAVMAMLTVRILRTQSFEAFEADYRPEAAVRYMKANLDLSKMRLYNSYDAGGYIEFSGIRAFIDSRAEIFTRKLNGKEDILKDYCDALTGTLYYSDFVARYSFTHLLVNKEDLMNHCLEHDRRFKAIYQDNKYVLYEAI